MSRTSTIISIVKILIKILPFILSLLDNEEVQECISKLNGETTNEDNNN